VCRTGTAGNRGNRDQALVFFLLLQGGLLGPQLLQRIRALLGFQQLFLGCSSFGFFLLLENKSLFIFGWNSR
jgi:hypothetical protein